MTATPVPAPRSNSLPLIVGAVVIAVAALACWLFFGGLTIDDAFITWRYARNWVDFGVWNYNPSTIDLVEAYTNPIFAFLALIPAALGLPIEAFFKFFMAVLAIVFVVWAWRREVPAGQRLVLIALIVANPIMQIHWWSGLETGLWIMLLTVVVSKLHRSGELGWAGSFGLLLLALTRPEGLGYLIVMFGWALLLRRGRAQWLQAGVVLAVVGVYWAIRTAYFGRLLPNTFYAKTASEAGGSGLLLGLVIGLAIVVAIPILVNLMAQRRGEPVELRRHAQELIDLYRRPAQATDRARWTPVVMAMLAVGIQFVIYANSNLQMDYANRFSFQLVMPVILICLAAPLSRMQRLPVAISLTMVAVIIAVVQANRTQVVVNGLPVVLTLIGAVLVLLGLVRRWGKAQALAAVALTVAVSMMPLQDFLWMSMYRSRLQDTHVTVGKVLAKHYQPGATVVVHDAGVVPYEATGWEVIDVYGLASRRITDNKMSVDDLAKINPEVVIADRFLAKQFLAKYNNRYDQRIPGSTIRLRKDARPKLKADLKAAVAVGLVDEKMCQPRYVLTHSPSFDWLAGGTR